MKGIWRGRGFSQQIISRAPNPPSCVVAGFEAEDAEEARTAGIRDSSMRMDACSHASRAPGAPKGKKLSNCAALLYGTRGACRQFLISARDLDLEARSKTQKHAKKSKIST